ncbi:MAG: TspO/MBR family protein [Candidatus Korobacteraceae bacterium]
MSAKPWLVLIVFFAICLGAGGLGSFFTGSSVREWYPQLRKPAGTPPSWIFGPVWTTLYVLMAISAWLVWRQYGNGARPALLIFLAQLALNVAWSAIFFGSRMPGVAFAEIVVLWLAIAFNIFVFYLLLPVSALLLVPYLLWVSYASYLNFGIWRLNRR